MAKGEFQPRSIEPNDVNITADRLLLFKAGHEQVMAQLNHVQDQQLAPYCELLADRIQTHILPVIEDGIEAASILQHQAATGLTESTRNRLWALLWKAASLPPVEGVGAS